MIRLNTALLLMLLPTLTFAGDPPPPCVPGVITRSQLKFRSVRSGYFPDHSEMEGGFKDRIGKPLHTLQDYLSGKATEVSVAMDHTDSRIPYGTLIRIPAVEIALKRCIKFRVVDTGGRFVGRGLKKIDLCNKTEAQTFLDFNNGETDVHIVGRN